MPGGSDRDRQSSGGRLCGTRRSLPTGLVTPVTGNCPIGWNGWSNEKTTARDLSGERERHERIVMGCQCTAWEKPRQDEFDGRVLDWIRTHDEREQDLLSAGFHDPQGLLEAAAKHKLCGDSFCLYEHSDVFCCLVECAKRGLTPTVELIAKTLEHFNRPAHKNHLGEPSELREMLELTEISGAGVDSWARAVAENAARRTSVRDGFRKIGNIMAEIAA